MDRPIGRAEAAFHVRAQRDAHDLASGTACHHPDGLRRDRNRCETLAQPERDQYAAAVRRELDAGAGLFKLLGLLVERSRGCPARASASAAVNPAMPAPAMMT